MKKKQSPLPAPSVRSKNEIDAQNITGFVGSVSHDLKNPLASIKAYAQIVKKRLAGAGDNDMVQYIEKIETQTDRATQLITELLDASRISEGKIILNKKLFRLDKLVKETIEDFQVTIQTHMIINKSNSAVRVKADKERIRRVLFNLLTNAVKYSPDAERVVVGMSADKYDAIVSIQDFGMGIPVSKQKHLFDPYFRVNEGGKKQVKGYGLGLPIVKRILEAHDGKVWLESKRGNGSTFFISLPFPK